MRLLSRTFTKNAPDIWLHQRYRLLTAALLLFALFTPLLAAGLGAVSIPPAQVLAALTGHGSGIDSQIIVSLRLPRILLAFIAGAGLSLAGAVLQLVTRNPLADPYLFGISSGASLGAVAVMTLLGGSFTGMGLGYLAGSLPYISLPVGAFAGAALSVMLVFALSTGAGNQVERMLLAGVATSFMFGAFSSLLLYFSEPRAAAAVLFWTLGSFTRASWDGLLLPALVVGLSLLILLGLKRQLLALQGGDETAHSLGIKVARFRLGILLLCSLITAVLVASCGGIGFVGLMVPHTMRLLLPGRQPLLLTALAGGIFMIWVDVLARCLLDNQELPVGVITAALGSVFFLLVLRRRRRMDYA
ncbi:ABC transporter permease [Shewanella sp. NFH-SH190041]|uniref:FecCD family ABC transporter permease n=1 Tax=Shewanella sp. NFH-SH190041 TaxID=2950245 RepID=UPI0021C26659|nr:iron ABC transporter permease [Shewanella sp. NFH-SH190041]BDM65706.1 ABC transporter permease [Shewanella sp. NFH-SH190041]